MNNKEYNILEEERGMASEPAAISMMVDSRSDIRRAITGEELLHRLTPRIQGLFKFFLTRMLQVTLIGMVLIPNT